MDDPKSGQNLDGQSFGNQSPGSVTGKASRAQNPSQNPSQNPNPRPPSAADYRISPLDLVKQRAPKSQQAPDLGGATALLAEFDAAERSEAFSRVLQKLIRSRHNFVPELLIRLNQGELAIAKKSALALGYLRSPQAVPALQKAALNPQRLLFPQATTALSHIGTPDAVKALVELLRSAAPNVQAAAAKALGRNSLPAVSPLVDALKRGDDLVKVHAAHSLGQIASPLAVTALVNTLAHPSRVLRLEAAWALGQIRSPLAAYPLAALLTDNDVGIQSQAAQSLKQIGAPALPALTEMLNNTASNTRAVAARTLGQMGLMEAVPLLIEVLQNDELPFVRCDAATALGEIGSYEAVFALSQHLMSGDRAVQGTVERALRRVDSAEARQALATYQRTLAVPGYAVAVRPPLENTEDATLLQW
ncbi:MAG TPA: PBS lyase [Cyanobacteria bacterium UBA8156]|jgi:HEAT repeat protein|nr:PBS lyase [Cyanobacteria bacterium UBA8156]